MSDDVVGQTALRTRRNGLRAGGVSESSKAHRRRRGRTRAPIVVARVARRAAPSTHLNRRDSTRSRRVMSDDVVGQTALRARRNGLRAGAN